MSPYTVSSAQRDAKGTSSKGNRLQFRTVNLVNVPVKFQPQIKQAKVRPFELTMLDMKVAVRGGMLEYIGLIFQKFGIPANNINTGLSAITSYQREFEAEHPA